MQRPLVIFDGDDTLWEVEPLYDAALDDAQRIVESLGVPPSEWRRRQREIDLRNVVRMGMDRDRFPLSSREALIELAAALDRPVTSSDIEAVAAASRAVFTMKAPLIKDARSTLEALREHYALVLLTKGARDIQTKRVSDSGLEPFFDHVEIVREKTDDTFVRLVESCKVARASAWSVGNSLASDINPALRAGLRAIWVEAHVWEHELRETAPVGKRVFKARSLREALGLLLSEVSPAAGIASTH